MEKQHNNALQVLQQTPPAAIAELDFVRDKFIANYNHCHGNNAGEMMYARQLVHFKQTIAASAELQKADRFSLYACFLTAAVNGYSLDPQDNEVYLLPIAGKAVLWRQAGAHIRRLQRTRQIKYADQPRIVYQGDDFEVVNGRVVKHVEKFASEIYVAAYVRFVLDDKGNDRFFVYRKSDWENWQKKSMQKAGDNWAGNKGQPLAAFLRTKVVKHACTEKCWAVGLTDPRVEQFNVEIDDPEDPTQETTDINHTEVNANGHHAETFVPEQPKQEPIIVDSHDVETF